jgi:small-conductance mechanosensitive channel
MENEIVNAADEAGNAVMNAVETAGEAVKTVGIGIVEETKSMFHLDEITNYLTWANLAKVVTSVVAILLLWIVYKVIRHLIKKNAAKRIQKKTLDVILKVVKYAFYVIVVAYVLGLFGIKISAIWGAAGIAGVAIGFAAQTSVSNLISGLFVLTEGSIKVGDAVSVGDVTGIVDEINLLSIHIHTFDNHMVRIPNSTIINSNFTNINYHKTRRITLNVSVDYATDMKTALEALQKAPGLCPTVVADPAPAVWFDGFGESGINMTVAAWFKPADFLQTKNDLYIAIKQVLDEAGITIPFNQLDVKIKEEKADTSTATTNEDWL